MKNRIDSRGFSVVELLILILVFGVLVGIGVFVLHFRAQKSHLLTQLNAISVPSECKRITLDYQSGNLDAQGTWTASYSCQTSYGPLLSAIQNEMAQKGYSSTINNYPKQGSLEYKNNASIYVDFIFGPQQNSNGHLQTFISNTKVSSLEIDVLQSH